MSLSKLIFIYWILSFVSTYAVSSFVLLLHPPEWDSSIHLSTVWWRSWTLSDHIPFDARYRGYMGAINWKWLTHRNGVKLKVDWQLVIDNLTFDNKRSTKNGRKREWRFSRSIFMFLQWHRMLKLGNNYINEFCILCSYKLIANFC